MSTTTTRRASTPAAADLAALVGSDLVDEMAAALVADIDRYLAARRRTAHPLVTATTEELVRAALAQLDTRSHAASVDVDQAPGDNPQLPRGLWRVLPDRLLALHPARRGEGVQRLRITTAEHLELTALVLERWGWSQTGGRIRTGSGRRCILGAQAAVFRLGYGTEDTAAAAGAHLNAVLRSRGITTPYPQWNELPHVDGRQALALIRDAATAARR